MFTVIGTGSRFYTDRDRVFQTLEDLRVVTSGPFLVRHGDCPDGADSFIKEWCYLNGHWDVYEDAYPADWDNCVPECPPRHRRMKKPGDTAHPGLLPDYCPKAGPRRNKGMAALGADQALAFPLGESYGTWNCVNECKKAGIPVKVVK